MTRQNAGNAILETHIFKIFSQEESKTESIHTLLVLKFVQY